MDNIKIISKIKALLNKLDIKKTDRIYIQKELMIEKLKLIDDEMKYRMKGAINGNCKD